VLTAAAVAGRPGVFGRETFDPKAFGGEAFGGAFGEIGDGADTLERVRPGFVGRLVGLAAADEPTKDESTASSAAFCDSSSRGSWRMASSLTLQPSEMHGDTTPAARSSIVSTETLRASDREEMTAIDGRASPCSIWLR